MIVSKIQGGLANQLFQWAFGKSLSIKYNTPLYLDLSFYDNQKGSVIRNFSLEKFLNIDYKILTNEHEGNQFLRINDDYKFKEIDYKSNINYYLDGYWQSEKYFINCLDIIKENLLPSKETISKLNETPLIDKNIVSMHIRRTDYVSSNGYHPI